MTEFHDQSESPSQTVRQLRRCLSGVMSADQFRFHRRLRAIEKSLSANQPLGRSFSKLVNEVAQSVAVRVRRAAAVPEISFPPELPISEHREEIAAALLAHPVVVVAGETGSGKSTQLPKLLLQMGFGVGGLIGHTQPRRLAARSVAARIAEELGSPLGSHVGFKVRFHDVTNPETHIKLMTDGVLLAETRNDRFLDAYDAIILDEAHERSLNIDFLLGYLKGLLQKRRQLKLIITSATIDTQRFCEHFADEQGPAPHVKIGGRTFPVEVRYRPPPEADAIDDVKALLAAVEEVAAIDRGDMLVFLPTERDIRAAAKALRGSFLLSELGAATEILPLYARLSAAEQHKVFSPQNKRRIILATNVAESSLTVPGIRFVIDVGTARISRFSPRSTVQRLPIEAISRASSDQRKGRCGRIGPGICLRLYSESDYLGRDAYTTPEIRRTNLASVILQAKSLGLGSLDTFPFLDPPRAEYIRAGHKTLFELGAIDERNDLTALGKQLSRLPVDPRIARIILAGHEEGCLHEILIIAAALEVQDPRDRPPEHRQAADESHALRAHESSDFMSHLALWDHFEHLKESLSRNRLRRACQHDFLSHFRLREWQEVHRQLRRISIEGGMRPTTRRDDYDAIHRALLTGLLSNIALREEGRHYQGAGGGKLVLWPGSAALSNKPRWIVASELVETTHRYARTAARIQSSWIEPLAGHLVKKSHRDPFWSRKAGAAMALERVTLFGLVLEAGRRVGYSSLDPEASRHLMIRHALVQRDTRLQIDFLEHNWALLDEIEQLGSKARRRDLLTDEQSLFAFYDARLPDVADEASLRRWWRGASAEQRKRLYLDAHDLFDEESLNEDAAGYPDKVLINSLHLPLDYRFEPGDAHDGVTLVTPQEALGRLHDNQLGWLVPGMLEEKIVALIRSLPKSIRRSFVPAPDVARRAVEKLQFGEGPFLASIAQALTAVTGETAPVDAFRLDKLPPHLRMNVCVVDEQGQTLAAGRDLQQLRAELNPDGEGEQSCATIDDAHWNRDGVRQWDFGDLPHCVHLQRGGVALPGYPTLIDEKDSVSVRLLESAAAAQSHLRTGVRRLTLLEDAGELKRQVDWLPGIEQWGIFAAPLCRHRLKEELATLLADRAYLSAGPLPRSETEFRAVLRHGRREMGPAVTQVARLVQPLFESHHAAKLAWEKASSGKWQGVADDIQQQMQDLAPEGFLTNTPWEWLRHYPRYFRAIAVRLQKLCNGGRIRDERMAAELAPYVLAHKELLVQRGGRCDEANFVQYRWMLEEYRVSLFAQELGAAITISAKRLEKQWAKVLVHA